MLVELCGGHMQPFIDHPFCKDEKLFFMFDFTHNLKNIYNNWLNKGRMNVPTEGFEDILGDNCIAVFDHVKSLYALEEHKVLKVAFSLKKISLNPNSIARTSPQHALSKVFHVDVKTCSCNIMFLTRCI